MSLDYQSQMFHRERLLGVGGAYVAALSPDGDVLKVVGFEDAGSVADLTRPGATDDKVLSVLRAQFDHCLKLQAGEATGCPQSVVNLYGSNFIWHEDADSLQGATVAWDGKRGMFTIAGNFAFSVRYTSAPPYGPSRTIQDSSSGQYIADLYWDGTKVVFVGFEK